VSQEQQVQRHAVITGASSGIGLAIARRVLRQPELGVIGLSRQPGPLQGQPRYQHWPTDLADLEATAARARRFRQEIGRCSLLVCAAGQGGFRPTDAWSAQELDNLVRLNLTSPMLLCAEMLSSLRAAGGALVVLVGSTSARERAPLGAAYAATKGGLERFAESLFMESRKQSVRVLNLCPGMTDTAFYQGERFSPEEGEETALSADDLAGLVDFFFAGDGRRINPTQLVLEPQRVGILKKSARPRGS
jgi:short-subunit dehydrogenase